MAMRTVPIVKCGYLVANMPFKIIWWGKRIRKNIEERSRTKKHLTAFGLPGKVLHTVRIIIDIPALVPSEDDVPSLVAEDSVPSLGLQVYDAGGIEFGTIELRSEELWFELACCWQRETGTILLPPEGTHLSTTAAELQDEILTAVVLVEKGSSEQRRGLIPRLWPSAP